jgi:UDP:flavonoid glycosyltransferase YjiC (YdhE family)
MKEQHEEKSGKKTLIFAVAGYNLAETGRMLEIAKAVRADFDVLFMSYGGRFEDLIEKEGFALRKMEPSLTSKKLDRLRLLLNGDTWITVNYFSYKELVPRVENEVRLFRELKPAAVLTGWCLSVAVSARVAKVSFVNVLHSTSIQEYYQAGLQQWPDRLYRLRRLFSDERLNRRINRRILTAALPVRAYNRIGNEYGLERFKSFVELIEGDYTLLADIPEWVGLPDLRSNIHHVGPLPARLELDIPEEVVRIPKDKPIVYFAMGSSGNARLIADIIEGFRDKPYRVIAPVKALVEDMQIHVPPNVMVTGFLPAHEVNLMADLSVIHGGQNTVMNACLSGTPIVGMGMHPEQEANLEACVRKGFAIRLNRWRDKASDVLKAIDKLLHDARAKTEVLAFQKQLRSWDGPANARKFLCSTFGSSGTDMRQCAKQNNQEWGLDAAFQVECTEDRFDGNRIG